VALFVQRPGTEVAPQVELPHLFGGPEVAITLQRPGEHGGGFGDQQHREVPRVLELRRQQELTLDQHDGAVLHLRWRWRDNFIGGQVEARRLGRQARPAGFGGL